MDRVELVQELDEEKCIGIDLKNLADPDTLNVGGADLKKWAGWHYHITGASWVMPLEQIHERLQKRLASSRKRR